MKISLYLDLKGHKDTDLRFPENGNPGIGGTQFMVWQLSYYLQKYTSHDITILTQFKENLPPELKSMETQNLLQATIKAKAMKSDLFIFRAVNEAEIYMKINELNLDSIAWGHNFASSQQLRLISNTKNILRYVCVSKQQLDFLRDHDVYKKSTYIYNALDFSIYRPNLKDKKNIVCYIGSIVPEKGFHVLAQQWSRIEKSSKNAELIVIGSGKLYDENAQLGEYGIAEKNYEKSFIKYLLDDNNKLKENVKFLGVLGGRKKIEIMAVSKVGVVNPTARTETFGIGAVEFQALQVPVVTKAKNGHFDTVIHKDTGLLFKRKNEMAKGIIKLLHAQDNSMGERAEIFAKKNFDIKQVVEEWDDLFRDLNSKLINQHNTNTNGSILENYKWLIEFNRALKSVKLFRKAPSFVDYISFSKKLYQKLK